ncbi:hypothetical protein [Streptomyces sp. NPDC002845]
MAAAYELTIDSAKFLTTFNNRTVNLTGRLTLADGTPVAGTRVFLRTYFESEYNARTVVDAKGKFTVRAKIRSYDNEFVAVGRHQPCDPCAPNVSVHVTIGTRSADTAIGEPAAGPTRRYS